MKITKDRNNKPEIAFLYFKAAKKTYDRIIVVPKTSPMTNHLTKLLISNY